MNAKTTFAAVAIAAGALVLSAPLASAGSFQGIEISPGLGVSYLNTGAKGVWPGKEMVILVGKGVCPKTEQPRVESALFPAEELAPNGDKLYARVLLGKVKPGTHTLTVVCHKQYRAHVKFQVLDTTRPTPTRPPVTNTAKPSPTTSTPAVPTKPKGAPETGGGATAADNDTLGYLVGGAVLAAGVGVGAFALRRRRAEN